jgi:GDPmannose 4,6-dehydratase
LREFVDCAFASVGLEAGPHLAVDAALARPSDIAASRGDPSRAAQDLGWRAQKRMPEVVHAMVEARRAAVASGPKVAT